MIIFQQAAQYFSNNRVYGENSREANRSLHMAAMSREDRWLAMSLIAPNYAKVWGPDISHWDGNVDLSITKARGASFVYIKGLDGTIQSRYFAENRARAVAMGLPHGPYGWLYRNVNVSCTAQAQAYDSLLNRYPNEMPPVIDFEWTYYGGVRSDPTFDDLRKWAVEWLRLGNPKAMLYSAAGFMNPLGRIPSDLKGMFAGLWVANYGVTQPAMPLGYGASEWEFHQFTSSGDAASLAPNDVNKKELDLNYFNGEAVDFARKYAGGVVVDPPPPSDGGSMELEVVSLTHVLSMRPLHQVVGSSSFMSIPKGTTVKGDELWVAPDTVVGVVQKNDVWAHVAYGGKMGWVALIHLGNVYGTYQDVTPAPPPADATITGVRFSGEVVFDLADGTQEVWHVTDMPFVKGPAV